MSARHTESNDTFQARKLQTMSEKLVRTVKMSSTMMVRVCIPYLRKEVRLTDEL